MGNTLNEFLRYGAHLKATGGSKIIHKNLSFKFRTKTSEDFSRNGAHLKTTAGQNIRGKQ